MPMKIYFLLTFCLLLTVFWATIGPALGREITDMAGRKVILPDVIKTAYAPSPYGFAILYSVAPETLAGLMFPLRAEDKPYLLPCVHDLPVIGRLSNTEALVAAHPDLLIIWGDKHAPIHQRSEEILGKLNIPYVYVTVGDLADLPDYPEAYAFLGRLFGKEEHTAQQAAWCRQALDEVADTLKSLPKPLRPRVYYAEGKDGLATECDDSLHVHLLRLAGDVNVHRGHTSCHMGLERVTIEQVKAYDPDVIIAQDQEFVDGIRHDPAWRGIQAVRDGRVHLIPRTPFNWFDRPPSFMRILGLKWLMQRLYPEAYTVDLVEETQDFYRLFLGIRLSADAARRIIGQ
ncbi:ABC transporter substrate-binding protein [Desulfosarcina cetonica]